MNKKYISISFCVILLAVIFTVITAQLTKNKPTLKNPDVTIASGEVTFKSQEGNYSVNITVVYDTLPDTDEPDAPEAERVAVVVYEYTNDDISHGLSIGNTHFKAYDADGNELLQFPQNGLFEPGEAGESDTYTSSVAFALNSDVNFLKIEYYSDTSSDSPDAVYEKEW